MALSRSERNALRAAKGQSTRGSVSVKPVSATGVTGTTYKANQPKPVEQKAIEQIVEVQKPTYDPTQDIQALAEARKKTQLAGLESRMQQGKSDIAERRANIPQQYREQRRQAGVQSKMAAKNFSEFLAQRGLARSGESAQAKLMQQSALQGQLGSIGRQEQSALDTLGRDEQRLQQQYLSDIGAIESGIGADTMQQMINARTQQEALQRQDRLRQEDIARQDQLLKQQARTNYLSQMGIADPYGGRTLSPEQLSSVSQFRDDYAAELNNPNLDPATRALIEQARFEKVTTDPRGEYFQQYGREYMTPDSIATQESKYAQTIANNALPDYQQEIENVAGDGDPINDWKLPILRAERERKIANLDAQKQLQIKDEQTRAFDMWKQIGVADQFISKALGIPVGTTTSEKAYKDAVIQNNKTKADIERIRANTAAAKETRLGTQKVDKETTTSNTKYKLNDSDKAVYKNLVEESSDVMTGLIDKNVAITRIKSLIDEGYNMDAVEKMAEQLGISESDIAEYVSSQQSQTQFNPSIGQFPLRIN